VMVRCVTLLGLAALALGPPNAWLAVRLVYGVRWAATPAPRVLSVYCAYLLLLAVNGEVVFCACVC
jgi:oligosaccharide translocation protein RFT1